MTIILMVRASYIIPLLLLASPASALDLDDTTYTDAKLGLRLHAPHGWKIHRQSGYPSMLVVLVSTDGKATISLAQGHLRPGENMEGFIKANCSAMRRVGLRVERCGPARVADRDVGRSLARTWNNAAEVQQYYVQSQGRVLVLTLGCPAKRANGFAVKLLQVLDTLTIKVADSTRGRDPTRARKDTATWGKRRKGKGKGEDALPELGKGTKPAPVGAMPEIGGPSSRPTRPTSQPSDEAAKPSSQPGSGALPELGSEPLPELGSEPLPAPKKK